LFPELLILTLLPLPFEWHLSIDKRDSQFSIKMVKKRMARSSCSAAARVRCGGRKDEGSTLSDEHKLVLFLPSLTSALFTDAHR
jgi:hypothetical protein